MALTRSLVKSAALSLLACYAWVRIRLSRRPTLLILTYHRILPSDDMARNGEQPGMVTTPQALANHIAFVKSLGAEPVHLSDWVERSKLGHELPKLAIAFTFDDGWRDNYQHAYPLLKATKTPGTIFLVTEMVDTQKTFWPEQVLSLLTTANVFEKGNGYDWLHPYLPPLADNEQEGPLSLSKADLVVGRLKELDDAAILQHLKKVHELHTEYSQQDQDRSMLSFAELREMSQTGLIRFGAHTKHHYRLNRLRNPETLKEEIVDCLNDIKSLGESAVSIFCYPNGDITASGRELVTNHYEAACTTKSGWNFAKCDPYDLKRFNLHDGNSASNRALLATIGRGLL